MCKPVAKSSMSAQPDAAGRESQRASPAGDFKPQVEQALARQPSMREKRQCLKEKKEEGDKNASGWLDLGTKNGC